jgi:hypothetical protein
MERVFTAKEEAFWRRLILPAEDRMEPERPNRSYRWFRSANVVAIEHYRQTEAARSKAMAEKGGASLTLLLQPALPRQN